MDTEEIDISLLLLFATMGMFLLASSIILFVLYYQKQMIKQRYQKREREVDYQKELLDATIRTKELEQKRIAQDLHDDIGALLSTIKLNVNLIGRNTDNKESLVNLIHEGKTMIDDAISNVRSISKDLLPATLEEFGLLTAVDELCSRVEVSTSMHVVFRQKGDTCRYDANIELALYRILQELLNNILKHSKASHIFVQLDTSLEEAILEVRDNGIAFNPEQLERKGKISGLGLKNIESRVNILGAKINYFRTETGENKVTIKVRN